MNLAEQLKEYQIRSKHDWASIFFFSPTFNFTSSRFLEGVRPNVRCNIRLLTWSIGLPKSVRCAMIRQDGHVKKDGLVTIEEQVCIFLQILAHHAKNLQIRRDNKQNYLGALDETYIKVNVPEIDKSRYRTRNGEIATNVLSVCNRNMEFIFVLPDWEGSTSYSRVLRDSPKGLSIFFSITMSNQASTNDTTAIATTMTIISSSGFTLISLYFNTQISQKLKGPSSTLLGVLMNTRSKRKEEEDERKRKGKEKCLGFLDARAMVGKDLLPSV
ncbi:hypothetical protein FNV43_RR11081 [Rhamnella rubrinervis]|uniref:DDE Tnp4 domain-containing protein n=1 Tax=Rhamnella rubrinervis TaxID=2594499 RepID=A0A8K0H5G6_9ROSA|nr:hypothetical protein FNV43_RR11081 [Rhamnella rubrinervis]